MSLSVNERVASLGVAQRLKTRKPQPSYPNLLGQDIRNISYQKFCQPIKRRSQPLSGTYHSGCLGQITESSTKAKNRRFYQTLLIFLPSHKCTHDAQTDGQNAPRNAQAYETVLSDLVFDRLLQRLELGVVRLLFE